MSFSSDITESRPVHERVISAVADANGVGPTELEPLYETVDPEALDALFDAGIEGTIQFTYEDHDVVVSSDGETSVDGTVIDCHAPRPLGLGDDSEASVTGR